MLINSNLQLRSEDFPSEQSWISKLLLPLNSFLQSATIAINGNLVYGDNLPCQTITLSFVYGSSADFPKKIAWSVGQSSGNSQLSPPVELRVCSATESGTAIAVVMAWSYSNGSISISQISKVTTSGITALVVGKTYKIVLRGQP